jgi:cell division protein FtsA
MITKGIRKGKILDTQAFKESLESAISEINKKLGGEYIDEYIITTSHPYAIHQRVREQKRIMRAKISNEDVRHLSTIVADISEESSGELMKIVPVHWIVDDKEKVKDPTGMIATKLDIVADIFYLPSSFYEELVSVIESIDIYVIDIIPNILATSEATIDYDAKDLGCVSIDIGKEQTSFVVYED